jgi:hypothetical protein
MIARTSHKFTVARNRKKMAMEDGARKIQNWVRRCILKEGAGTSSSSQAFSMEFFRWNMLPRAAQKGARIFLGHVVKHKARDLTALKKRFKEEYLPLETSRADALDLVGSLGSVLEAQSKLYPTSNDINVSLSVIAALVKSLNMFDYAYLFDSATGLQYAVSPAESLRDSCIAQFQFRTRLFTSLHENLLKIRRFYDFELPLKNIEHCKRLVALHAVEVALRFHYRGMLNKATVMYNQAFATLQSIFKKCRPPGHPILAVVLLEIASLALSQGNIEKARKALKRSSVVFRFHEHLCAQAETHYSGVLRAKHFRLWLGFLRGIHEQREAAEARFALMRTSLHKRILRKWLKFAQESEARWEKTELCHRRFDAKKCLAALVKFKENAIHEKHVKVIAEKARVFREKSLKDRMLKRWVVAIPLIKTAKVHRKRAALKWKQVLMKKAFWSWDSLVVAKRRARMALSYWGGKTLEKFWGLWRRHHYLHFKATLIKKGARGLLARKNYKDWVNDSFQEYLGLSPETVSENMSGKSSRVLAQWYHVSGDFYALATARAYRSSLEFLVHEVESGFTHRVELDFEIVRCLLCAHPKLNFHLWNLSWMLEGLLKYTIEVSATSIVTGDMLHHNVAATIDHQETPLEKIAMFLQHSDTTRAHKIGVQLMFLNAESRQIVRDAFHKERVAHFAKAYVASVFTVVDRRQDRDTVGTTSKTAPPLRHLAGPPHRLGVGTQKLLNSETKPVVDIENSCFLAAKVVVRRIIAEGVAQALDTCRVQRVCRAALSQSVLVNRISKRNKDDELQTNSGGEYQVFYGPRCKPGRIETPQYQMACAFACTVTAMVVQKRVKIIVALKLDSVEDTAKMKLKNGKATVWRDKADESKHPVLLISPPQIAQAVKYEEWHMATTVVIDELKRGIKDSILELKASHLRAIEDTAKCQQWSNNETQRLYASLLKCQADRRLLNGKVRVVVEETAREKRIKLQKRRKEEKEARKRGIMKLPKKDTDEPRWIESAVVTAKEEQSDAEISQHVQILELCLQYSRKWKRANVLSLRVVSFWELAEIAAMEHRENYTHKFADFVSSMHELDLQARQMNDANVAAEALCALSERRALRSQIRQDLIHTCASLHCHLDQMSKFASQCKGAMENQVATLTAFRNYLSRAHLELNQKLDSETQDFNAFKKRIQKMQYQAAMKMARLLKQLPKERHLYLMLIEDEKFVAQQVCSSFLKISLQSHVCVGSVFLFKCNSSMCFPRPPLLPKYLVTTIITSCQQHRRHHHHHCSLRE